MSWCQQLLKQRSMREATISEAPAARLLYDIASPELKLSDVTWGSRECSESCLRVSAEALPGSPPCVFCSFAQPRYFAGMIYAALNVRECTSLGCGVDGQVCGVCSSRRYRHYYNCYHRYQRHVTTAMAGRGGISSEASDQKMSDSRISPSPLLEGRSSGPIITATTPPSRLVSLVPGPVVNKESPDARVQGRAAGGQYLFQRSPAAAPKLGSSNCGFSGRRSPDSHVSEIVPAYTTVTNNAAFVSKSDISQRASHLSHQSRTLTTRTTTIETSRQASPPLRPVAIKLATKPSAATVTMMRAWHPEAVKLLSGQAGPFLGSSYEDSGRLINHQRCRNNLPKKLNDPMTLMTSSSLMPLGLGTFFTYPSPRRYPTSLSTSWSSESSHSGKTVTSDCLMRQTQSTAVSDKDTAWGTASRRRSSHMSKRHRGFLPELPGLGRLLAATESEEQASSLDENVGDHHLVRHYRCWRRSLMSHSSQRQQAGSDFRLPGEPRRSAARWRNNQCPTINKPDFKYGNVMSGQGMETASTKRRRVDGDGDDIIVEPRLTSPPEAPDASVTAAPMMPRRSRVNSQQADDAAIGTTETKRQHTNAETVAARTTKKRRKICLCGGSQPTFGLPKEPASAARWCSDCPDKPSRAINVKNKRCLCGSSQPSFGLPGGSPAMARWCSKCPEKPAIAVDVKHKRCVCTTSIPNFGLPGEPAASARWCSKCPDKPSNAVDVKNKRCHCGSSQPSLGLPGDAPAAARWCSKCPDKPPNAVGVKSKRCNCGISQPSFGLKGERATLARWCYKCPDKPLNAVNLKSKKCLCGSSVPSFGLPGEPPSASRWCSHCPDKSPAAIDVKNKKSKRCA